MFRFLVLKKNYTLAIVLVAITTYLICTPLKLLSAIPLFLLVCIFLNSQADKILRAQTGLAYGPLKKRNVSYLVIGDLYKAQDLEGKSVAYIQTPNKTLEGSVYIMKRMFSIVDETDGTIIIAINKKNEARKGLSLFEYSFLTQTHKEELKRSNLKRQRKFPLLFRPISTIQLIFNQKNKNYRIVTCPDETIERFCKERGLKFEYRVK